MTQPESLGRRTLAALVWSYGGSALRAVLQLVFQLALARLLGPEAFGQAAIAMLVLSFGWILSEAGFGAALIQKEGMTDDDVRYALGWVLLSSSLLAVVIVALSGFIAEEAGDANTRNLLIVAGLLVPIQAVCNIPTSLMRRRLQAKQAQTIFLSGYALCYGLVGIPAAVAGAGPWALLGAFASHSVFHLVVSWRVARCPWRPTLQGDASLIKFGLKVTLANMGNWASENVDRFLISRFWGAAALGAYGAAANLSRAPASLITGSLQSVAFASASRVQQAPEIVRASFLAMVNVLSVLTWPVLVAMAVLADPIIHLLYGERWALAGPLFCAFSLALIPVTILSVIGPLLWAVNRVAADVQGQLLTICALVGGLVVLANRPLEHAVWVVPAAYALRTFWMGSRLAGAIGASARDIARATRGGLLLAMLTVLVAWVSLAVLPPVSAMAATAVAGAILVLGMLRLWPRALLPEVLPMLRARAAEVPALGRLARWLGEDTP